MKKSNKNKSILLMLLGRPNGFSLVEVMVAAGMLGVVSLGVMQLTQNTNKTAKSVSQAGTILELGTQIQRALTVEAGCTATLSAMVGNVDGINAPTSWTTTQTIFGQNGASRIVTMDTTVDPGPPPRQRNHYGSGLDSVVVQMIEVGNYQESGSVAAPINESYGTVDVRVTFSKGNPNNSDDKHRVSSFGSRTVRKTYSNINIVVRDTAGGGFGARTVKSCKQDQNQFLSAACQMIGGTYDNTSAAGQPSCVNIKIYNAEDSSGGLVNANDRNRPFAIVARNANTDIGAPFPAAPHGEGSIKAEGGLVVGDPWGELPNSTTPPGMGNFYAQNSITVGPLPDETSNVTGNATFKGILSVGENYDGAGGFDLAVITGATNPGDAIIGNDMTVARGLGVGVQAPPTAGQANIETETRVGTGLGVGTTLAEVPTVAGQARIELSLSVGDGLTPSATDGQVEIKSSLGVGAAPPAGIGDAIINNDLTVTNSIGVGVVPPTTPGDANINNSLGVGVNPPGGPGTMGVGANIVLGEASHYNLGGRTAIRINNMAAYTFDVAGGTLAANARTEVPTKHWVFQAVGDIFSQKADMDALASAINGYITSNPLSGIQQTVCEDTRVRRDDGVWISGTWNGTTCSVDTYYASCGNSNANKCSTFWSTHFRSVGGHFYARNSTDTATTAYMRGSDGYIYTTGNVRGLGYGYFSSYARAARFCIGGSSGNACITRTESRCSAGQFVVGWEQGQVTCVNATSSGW